MPTSADVSHQELPFPGEVDTAVVGAGVAGLYTAFRLTADQPAGARRSVAVFEASARTGGRLHTARPTPDAPPLDLGGMRYLRSQRVLSSLVDNVLCADGAPPPRPFCEASAASTVFHLRGHTFSQADMQDAACSPHVTLYGLPARWRGHAPADVVAALAADVLAASGAQHHVPRPGAPGAHAAWARVKRDARYGFDGPLAGIPLRDLTFAQVVLDRAGAPTWRFLRDALGYNDSGLWTAADEFEVYGEEFTTAEVALAPRDGMDSVPGALLRRAKACGAHVFTRARLVAFARADGNDANGRTYVLRFADGRSVRADEIVLALPRCALEPLVHCVDALAGPDAGARFARALRSVGMLPAVKVGLWFERAWWARALGENATVTTDLPLRQAYLFAPRAAGGMACAIATYSDLEHAQFWQALQAGSGGCDGDGAEEATQAVQAALMAQLRAALGDDAAADAPDSPAAGVFRAWDGEAGRPTACHFWRVARDPCTEAALVRVPARGERVFVCGEAFSDRHGWVEGALCSAERVVREQFGLGVPDWFDGGNGDDAAYSLGC